MYESVYVLCSMAVFSVIGMLTDYVHGHGEDAGAACGGLAGFILAICVPAMLDTSFLSKRRTLQYWMAGVAFLILLALIYVMYDYKIAGLFQ